MLEGYREFRAVNLQRYAVLEGEYLYVAQGFALVVDSPVFRVDGWLRVDGVVRIG